MGIVGFAAGGGRTPGGALMPGGGSYEINQTNPYAGIITAISDGASATLTGLECI